MKSRYFLALAAALASAACAGTEQPSEPVGTTPPGTDTSEPSANDQTPPVDDGPGPGAEWNVDPGWDEGWPQGGAELASDVLQRVQALPGCVVAQQDANDEPRYTRRSFDAALGVVRAVPVDADGAPADASDPHLSRSLFWRWNDEGRLLMKAGGGSGYRPFRHDYSRDEHGNVTAFLFTYDDVIDLDAAPSGELYMATYYANSYGPDGLLTEHRVDSNVGDAAWLSPTVSYAHDARGRCERIELVRPNRSEIEHREYDANDRIIRTVREVELRPATGSGGTTISIERTLRHDDQGRLIRAEVDGQDLEVLASADGVPDAFTRIRYGSDGSKWVETLSFTGDVRNDRAEVDGEHQSAWHSFELWSAGCAEVEAAVATPTRLACIADF